MPWSLSNKLLFLTIVFVMIAEVLIYIPSIANFRNVWLKEKLDTVAAGGDGGERRPRGFAAERP